MKKLLSVAILTHSFSKVHSFDNVFVDAYKGCHVQGNISQYLTNQTLFNQKIEHLLNEGKTKYSSIWIELDQKELALAPCLVQYGFKMHRVSDHKLQFSKWLRDDENKLPSQATHFVGVGGIVVNEDNILLVQEKNGTRKGAWGTPGGQVDPKESLIQAVKREVKEETNLDCEVEDVLYFREMHNTKFNKPDIYFAFKLKCKNNNNIKICDKELMDYRWVPINDMLNFLEKENQKPFVINFYKSVQERLIEEKEKYMNIQERTEKYYNNMANFGIYKPKM